jgi:hypothetical protein
MKVTSILSLLLCIGTVAMPVVEASFNGFGLKRSALTKRSIQHQDVFDFAAQQQSHRGLKLAALLSKRSATTKRFTKNQKAVEVDAHHQRRSLQTDSEIIAELALCEVFLAVLLGPDSGCTCSEDEPSTECNEFISSNCLLCDTLQGEEACLFFDEQAALAAALAAPETDIFVDCLTYESGPFAGTAFCGIESLLDNTCTFTINETECTSCTVVACDVENTFDIDCSNIIAGETWNLCTDDIPETSPFIAVGTNDRFEDLSCSEGDADTSLVELEVCQAFLDATFGIDSGCLCEFENETLIPSCECVLQSCDTLQGEEACLSIDLDAELVATTGLDDGFANCLTYDSGPFADTTICLIEDLADSTCTITIDGMECNSCTVIACGDDTDYEFDCSNIIEGETWNLCTSDIPETSPFIAVGNNLLFSDVSCSDSDGSNPGVVIDTSCEALTACDTLQGEEACFSLDLDAAQTLNLIGLDGIADCLTYESGPFADTTICVVEDFADSTCTITIDGMECNSCDVVTCSDPDESYDVDCSNIIAGETWNLCSDDIPETSPFIAVGNNLLFSDVICSDSDGSSPGDVPETETGESDGSNPGDDPEAGESAVTSPPTSPPTSPLGGGDSRDGGDMSGGVGASSHVLSLVGLVIVTFFW